MRVVVTGVTGNVGTAVARRLAREDDLAVVGISRRPPSAGTVPMDDWRRVDLAHPESQDTLEEVLHGADALVHLAWQIQPSHDPLAMSSTNIDGTMRTLRAAADAGIRQIVIASSVGAYSPGSKDRRVDESWPTGGIDSSLYSRHKAQVERLLDRFETEHPDCVVTRLRPGLIFQRQAASEIARYFLGPFVPAQAATRVRLPRVPLPSEFVFQAVHADDVAEAYLLALRVRAGGAFNIAADPPLGPHDLAEVVGGTPLTTPLRIFRAGARLSWQARLQPTDEGWIDLAARSPLMATGRAREVLGWEPRYDAHAALDHLVAGLRTGAYGDTPPLRSRRHQRWRTQ
jgi:UDP-glucose 4-epimerase